MASWMKKIDEKKAELTVAQKELDEFSKEKQGKHKEEEVKNMKTEPDKEEWLDDLEQHAKELNSTRRGSML